MSERFPLFVYGSLRRGFWNAFVLGDALFLGRARTKHRYALYADGLAHAQPAPPISQLVGEVYGITPTTLEHVDALKGHPDWFCRDSVPVILDDGQEAVAWIYFSRCPSGTLVENGDFQNSAR